MEWPIYTSLAVILLSTIVQKPRQSLDNSYKIFKAQIDTIDTHKGNAWHYPVVYALHFAALPVKKKKKRNQFNTMLAEDNIVVQSEAMQFTHQERLNTLRASSCSWQTKSATTRSRRPITTTTC